MLDVVSSTGRPVLLAAGKAGHFVVHRHRLQATAGGGVVGGGHRREQRDGLRPPRHRRVRDCERPDIGDEEALRRSLLLVREAQLRELAELLLPRPPPQIGCRRNKGFRVRSKP